MTTTKTDFNALIPTLSIILLFIIVFVWIMHLLPSKEERRAQDVQSIKYCQDNGLDAYRTESGEWFCEPKTNK